jgi:hypothetical protein
MHTPPTETAFFYGRDSHGNIKGTLGVVKPAAPPALTHAVDDLIDTHFFFLAIFVIFGFCPA